MTCKTVICSSSVTVILLALLQKWYISQDFTNKKNKRSETTVIWD